MAKIKITPALTQEKILLMVLDINIESIENILLDNQIKEKWKLLWDNYDINGEIFREPATNILNTYRFIRNHIITSNDIPTFTLKSLKSTWYNTLKSTLFMLEPQLLEEEPFALYAINKLWDIFLEIDYNRKDNFINLLNLKSYVDKF